jgi:hypothetical protein
MPPHYCGNLSASRCRRPAAFRITSHALLKKTTKLNFIKRALMARQCSVDIVRIAPAVGFARPNLVTRSHTCTDALPRYHRLAAALFASTLPPPPFRYPFPVNKGICRKPRPGDMTAITILVGLKAWRTISQSLIQYPQAGVNLVFGHE